MADGRSKGSDWYLGDAEEEHRAHPKSFFIPSRQEREALTVGAVVRLLFFVIDPAPGRPRAERMWVEVTSAAHGRYVGSLMNRPAAITDLSVGEPVGFGPEHVIGVRDPRWEPYENRVAFVSRRLLEDDTAQAGFVCHESSDEQRPPRSDGSRPSGWQVLVGDETEDELADPSNVRLPNLAWLMERYPAFGDLVFSGSHDGSWVLDVTSSRYRPA